MDLSISPDVEAYYCYLIVLLIGAWVARKRVSELLEGFRGAWVRADIWMLLGVYMLLPVALFWLLDRTGALHDTSLLGAVLVAIGYRQIIVGGVQGLAAPSQLTGAWQPLVDWTDKVAARIRDRIQRFNARYEERLLTSIVGDQAKMDNLVQLAQGHAPNPADVDTQLKTLASAFAALGPAGVARKQAA